MSASEATKRGRTVTFPYTPAAISNVACAGSFVCPDCGGEATYGHGIMGSGEPMRCGWCFDEWAFRGRPAVRAEMEAKRDFLFSGVRHLLDRVTWAEACATEGGATP